MKKKIVIIIGVVVVLLLGSVGVYLIINNNRNNNNIVETPKEKEEVVSTVILDINPSIKIELNKDNEVIKVTALNEDAKDLVNDSYKGINIKNAIKEITTKLYDKGYLNGDTTILLNTTGIIKNEMIKELFSEELTLKKVKYEIIVPEITDSSKELAQKYQITESKATYLEEVIKSNPDLKIEDLVDKSINEIVKVVKEKEEDKKNSSSGNRNNNGGNTGNSSGNSTVKAPSDPKDTSGVWCTFRKNLPYNVVYNYTLDIGMNKATEIAKSSASINVVNSGTRPYDDKRSSYCFSYEVWLSDNNNKYYFYIDSVTGNIIDKKVVEIEKPKISEAEARQKGIDYFKLVESECDLVQTYLSLKGDILKYTFLARCKGTTYTLVVNGKTGELSEIRTW